MRSLHRSNADKHYMKKVTFHSEISVHFVLWKWEHTKTDFIYNFSRFEKL